MSTKGKVPRGTDREEFRHIVGHLASGVTVVTTSAGDRSFGMTASSVTSLSLDPPMMLACLNLKVPTAEAVVSAGRFGINVLGSGQEVLAGQFAVPSDDKFKGVPVDTSDDGIPLLRDAHAQIECKVVSTVDIATHRIIIGEVVSARASTGKPLTYYRGGFGRFQHVEDELAYDAVRALILSGEWRSGRREGEAVAEQLGIEESAAFYALTRLSGEGIVEWESGSGYAVTESSVRVAREAIDARSIIERGVIEDFLAGASQAELARVTQSFDAMAALMVGDVLTDPAAFWEANFAYHRSIVELAQNASLTAAFDRLHLTQVMARLQGDTAQSSHSFIDVQRRLLDALLTQDVVAAVEAVRDYSALATARALELGGGRTTV
jgi:flavin reductase (DIM6/NTAB) family NADH-FMN oxidoreductase RutF/DNA-binding GntR family transcriptional regulator